MKKKVLVCGATGFIGRNVAEHLSQQENFEVYGTYFKSQPLNNPNITMIKADLTKKDDVQNAVEGKEIIIQAAATTSGAKDIVSRPYIHVTDNAVMNAHIFRQAFENNCSRVVFFSCSVMYKPSERPVKEEDFDASQELVPSYFGVGWTKVYNEKMCEFFSKIGDAKYTVLRHSNIYGPHDKFDLERSHVLGATVTKVMNSRDGKIVVWGTGEEERDLLYISDLTNFLDLALARQEEKFGLYNVGSERSVSVKDLVGKIIGHSGRDIRREYDVTKPTIKTKLSLDTHRARERFGWEPQVSLDEGLRRTLDWYRDNVGKL